MPTAHANWKIPCSVLVVIHTPGFQVLLLERADAPDFWQSVTGAKNRLCESWRSTAIREVLEETGIHATQTGCRLHDWRLENVYEIYPQWRHRYAPDVTHNTERVFGLQVPEGTPVRLAPLEHTAWGWWPWMEAADRCFSPSNAEAILALPRLAKPQVRLSGALRPPAT